MSESLLHYSLELSLAIAAMLKTALSAEMTLFGLMGLIKGNSWINLQTIVDPLSCVQLHIHADMEHKDAKNIEPHELLMIFYLRLICCNSVHHRP